jgi:NAD(P)H dehydrogenase (quinone)
MSKVFVLLGNTEKESFTGSIADAYVAGAEGAGHETRRLNIGDLQFDPILHKGYRAIQPLEPDLLKIQDYINWCDHFVIIYPNWWCSMPAIVKGMFDRMWIPGFAFNFEKPSGNLIQRLAGKTARVIVTAGSNSPIMTWMKYGDFTNEIEKGILGFAGFTVAVSTFGPCEKCENVQREEWIEEIRDKASRAE